MSVANLVARSGFGLMMLACYLLIPALFVVLAWVWLLEAGFGLLGAIGAVVAGFIVYRDGSKYVSEFRYWYMDDDELDVSLGQMGLFTLQFAGLYFLVAVVTAVADWLSRSFGFFIPSVVALLAGGGMYAAVRAVLSQPFPEGGLIRIERGARLLSQKAVKRKSVQHAEMGSEGPMWGDVRLPWSAADTHFSVTGCTRSGKTVTIRILMQSVLPRIQPGSGHRALVFDAKGEMLGHLRGMGLQCDVITLHPGDVRGWAWDIAADVTDPNAAKTIAALLVPDEETTEKFFPLAARAILESALRLVIKRSNGRWDLADVLQLLNDVDLLRQAFLADPRAKLIERKYFHPPKTFQNTITTLDTLVSQFETVVAAWRHTRNSVSLQRWAREESSILVLKRHADMEAALDPMNRLLFERLAQVLLSGPDVSRLPPESRPRTWIFLDEAAKAGKLPKLNDLLLQGSSKGVSVVLGFQGISSMWEEYGKDAAESLLEQCATKAFLKLNGKTTADWAAGLFGEYECLEEFRSVTSNQSLGGGSEKSETFTQQRNKRETVLWSDLLQLKLPAETGHVDGYYIASSVGAYRKQYNPASFLSDDLDVPEVVPRPASDFELSDGLSGEDLRRLGLDNLGGQESGDGEAQGGRAAKSKAKSHPLESVRRYRGR